jgi:hypothetical protein
MSSPSVWALLECEPDGATVRSAAIAADLVENSFARRPLALEHRIAVMFHVPGAELRLGPLALGARSWAALEQLDWRPAPARTTYSDGKATSTGDVHGNLVLDENRVPVACHRIRFGALEGDKIGASLDLATLEPDRPWHIDVTLTLGPIRIIGDVFVTERPGLDAALALAAQHLDLACFHAGVDDGVVVLRPR